MIQQRQYLHHLGIHRHISCKCLLRSINILVILDNNLVKDDLATFTTASKMINYNTFTVNYITRTVHSPISSRPSAADFHGSRWVSKSYLVSCWTMPSILKYTAPLVISLLSKTCKSCMTLHGNCDKTQISLQWNGRKKFTHWSRVTHKCVSKLSHHWFR